MSKRPLPSPDPPSSKVYTSESIHDRASIFIAHYSPLSSAKELQADPSFKTASHRIAAWRKPSTQRSLLPGSQNTHRALYDTGHDDDGEKYAGKKLENVLEAMNVEGAVVVARWYGGVLLGPVRFTHIETCARDAIKRWKEGVRQGQQEEEARRKQMKIEEDDQASRERLIGMLKKRDQSIAVLRDLLDQKKRAHTGKSENELVERGSKSPLTKEINYGTMTLVRLKGLEKARDASISWLLKQIDEAEKKEGNSVNESVEETPSESLTQKSQENEVG